MSKPVFLPFIQFFLCIFVGCTGTFEVGVERTPTPNYPATATMTALISENARLATLVARQVTPTPLPINLGRLTYVQGGDIWVKPLPDGKPLRLTTDGRNREPHWSPSGEWIAFRKERQAVVMRDVPCDPPKLRQEICREPVSLLQKQVWLIENDGNGARVLNQGLTVESFAWAPALDWLAYVTASGELQVVHAESANISALVPQPTSGNNMGKPGRIAWSPDGKWIAYDCMIQQPDLTPTYQGVWKASLDGKDRVELYASDTPQKGEVILAGWSPLGKTILLWQTETRAALVADAGPLLGIPSEKRQASANPAVKKSSDAMLPYSDFIAPAPLGSSWADRDAAAIVVGGGQSTWFDKRIELNMPLTPSNLAAIFPSWSPSGTRLAYVAMPVRGELSIGDPTLQELMQRRIWVTNTTGEWQPRRLTDAALYRDEKPLWSADGSHILFARIDAKGRATLWVISVDSSSAPHQVADELTPAPDPLGLYGYVDWNNLFDWWRGVPAPGTEKIME